MKKIAQIILAALFFVLSPTAWADANTDFMRAVERDDPYTVKRMIDRGFDAAAARDKGQTALVLALREDSARVVDVLLALPQVPALDVANVSGETPLMMAALRGRRDWVLKLLERGAAVNRTGWAPLHYAASGPEPGVVALLLDRGADIDARAPNGNTPLIMASRYGAIDSAKLLLARGANPRLRGAGDQTAADGARAAGRDSLAERLDAALR